MDRQVSKQKTIKAPASALSRLLGRMRQRGFSLVEIALVLVIVGLALGGVISALGPQMQQRRYVASQDELKRVTDALFGFAVLNGRLPCPAVVAADNGLENQISAVTGQCANNGQGYLPGATLGLPDLGPPGSPTSGLLIDAWGFPVRYAVSQNLYLTDYVFTKTDGVKTAKAAGAAGVTAINTTLLRVCSAFTASLTTCVAGQQLAAPAFVVFSTGSAGTAAGGTDETKNINKVIGLPPPPAVSTPLDVVHIYRQKSELAANPFDDLFYWQSASSLVSRICSTPSC